ncbi:uncharacterized protein LOC130725077 [Lotus japonicus]|uniref:uncharacterized protein LOC130725077 n=1 Tax=Lotus japonicus TaxID=34305 RepID=UPI002585BCB7|nr:uncharacterized protein LOC130725077 [Lotus japonicus]
MEEIEERSLEPNSVWCNNIISRIRKVRAKRGPNFTFQMVSDVGSSSINMTMVPLSLHEEGCCEFTSLMGIHSCVMSVTAFCRQNSRIEDKYNDDLHERKNEVLDFLNKIEQQFDRNNCEMESGWYSKKIEEARLLIAKYEPALFSLQSHDVESSSINIPWLHKELCYKIRLLIRIKCVDLIAFCGDPVRKAATLKIELQEGINKVNKFLSEINLQLKEKICDQNSDWYSEKVAEARTLIAKRYSTFLLRPQGVGYTKDQYQIFLSFRGEDTRYGFTRYLFDALHQAGFNVFMDDRGLERGDSISQILMEAIENSRLSIIIFSKHFANSTWCLDEVVKILECKQKKNQLVWPVFYKVEPSDVRYQNRNYGEAMTKHETRYGDDVVRNWRSALHQVCGFNAFPYKKNSGYVICLISFTFI